MKKIISLIAAVCLVLALLPAGSSGGVQAAGVVLEDGKSYVTADQRFSLLYNDGMFTITEYRLDEPGVILPTYADGIPIITIAKDAFFDKQLTTVILPPLLFNVEARAFNSCANLRYVVAQSKTEIADGAFYNAAEGLTVCTTTMEGRYYDVLGWAAPYIYALTDKGIVNGKGEGQFKPNDNITRAEFCKILAGASGESYEDYKYQNVFADVPSSAWYAGAVNWAASIGVVNGVGSGNFAPGSKITREQIAAMTSRYAFYRGVTLSQNHAAISFADGGSISAWAQAAVTQMQRAGIINGYGDSTFRPKKNATRAEASKIISIYLASDTGGAQPPAPPGVVTYGSVSVDYGGAGKPTVQAGTALEAGALTPFCKISSPTAPNTPVTVSAKLSRAPSSDPNTKVVLTLGFEYVDDAGNAGILYADVDATVSGSTASATFTPADYANIYDRVDLAGGATSAKDPNLSGFDYHAGFTEVHCQYKTGGKFYLYHSRSALPNLTDEDMKAMLDDIESIFQEYLGEGYSTPSRTAWPFYIKIVSTNQGMNGAYYNITGINRSWITLSGSIWQGGYVGKPKVIQEFRAYIAHELFHFVQNNYYAWGSNAIWFGEATATYYEYKKSRLVPRDAITYIKEIWDGFVPYWTNNWASRTNGYARFPVIQYLMEQNGTPKFILDAHKLGGHLTAAGWTDNITKAAGKSIGAMAGNFYEMFVGTDQLALSNDTPAMMVRQYYQLGSSSMYYSLGKLLRVDLTQPEKLGSVTLSVPGYGARYAIVNAGTQTLASLPCITFTTAATADIRAFVISSDGKWTVVRSSGGKLTIDNPGERDIFLLVVDTSGSETSYTIEATGKKEAVDLSGTYSGSVQYHLDSETGTSDSTQDWSIKIYKEGESYLADADGITLSGIPLTLSGNVFNGYVYLPNSGRSYSVKGTYQAVGGEVSITGTLTAYGDAARVISRTYTFTNLPRQ